MSPNGSDQNPSTILTQILSSLAVAGITAIARWLIGRKWRVSGSSGDSVVIPLPDRAKLSLEVNPELLASPKDQNGSENGNSKGMSGED